MFSPFCNDLDDESFFGPHMNPMSHMNNMMNTMFANTFGIGNSLMPRQHNNGLLMFPGFNTDGMFANPMLPPNGTNHSFSSSTVVSMTHGPDGRPQIYKSSSSVKSGPGGIRETQRSEVNSMTGTKKMAIGHHIGDKSHIVEQQQNLNTGDREENEELVNLDEDELDGFKREWEVKARQHKRHDPLRLMNTPKIRSSPLALPPALTQTPNNTSTSGRRSHLLGSTSSGHSRKNRHMKSVSGNQNERN